MLPRKDSARNLKELAPDFERLIAFALRFAMFVERYHMKIAITGSNGFIERGTA